MATLPGGFSPKNAALQAGSYINPTGGVTDYDVFSEKSFAGGDRSPAGSQGVYWRGADGNVYVKGSQGTNSAGRFDSNSNNYWQQRGYSYINDPNSPSTENTTVTNNTNNNNKNYKSSQTAAERAQYDDQVNYINSLLGGVGARRDAGLGRLDASYNDAKNRMTEQQTKDMKGYDEQSLKNTQNRQKGIDQVDQFANDSYTSLQRLLQGAGAGNSSVARDLVPRMVSKAAGTRRQGVIDTAGENEAAIVNARKDAEDQYRYNFQDQENQYKEQKQNFLEGILGQENELINKRMAAEAARAAANGGGYAAARAATAQSRADLDARTAQLNSLFGQYAPSFTAKAMNLKTPDLAQYQVDRAQITGDQSVPSQYRAYLPQIKKRKEEL